METPRKESFGNDDDVIFLTASKLKEGIMNIPPSPLTSSTLIHHSTNSTRPGGNTSKPLSSNGHFVPQSPEKLRSVPPEDEERGVRPSAIKRGIIKIDPLSGKISPLKSSPGRSRTHSYYRSFNRIARRKALLSANAHLNPLDRDLEDLSEDDVAFAERIIEESRRDESPSTSFTPTPRMNKRLVNFDNDGYDNDAFESVDGEPFVETPVPSPIEEKKIIQRYGRAHTLLKAAQTLFIDGPEGYFEQHKYKGKASGNTMTQAPLLEYDEFNQLFHLNDFLHFNEITLLKDKYRKMFTQWYFELSQGFNLVFYGIGTKRKLLLEFADRFLLNIITMPLLVINGYNPATGIKEIVEQVISLLVPERRRRKATISTKGKARGKSSTFASVKFPASPYESVPILMNYMEKQKDKSPKLVLLIHNIDSESLRNDKIQTLLAQIASLPHVWLICSIDQINSPLLWDSAKTSLFNFAWHDITTYEPYLLENQFKDILSIGKSSKSLGAKGAKYVLSSLTQNARNLYRVLVSNQLQAMEDELLDGQGQQDRSKTVGSVKNGIEFKVLYNLCVEEFIASNEISFRIMLREFIEHDMAGLVRNNAGTEIVFVPLTVDELEQLLTEELLE